MNNAMEIHDSFLLELSNSEDGYGHVLFHACIHRSESNIFESISHESGWQNLRFDFVGMQIEGAVDLADKPYASDGNLSVNGKNEENGIVYLPAEHSGDICLEMHLAPTFETVKIRASQMTSILLGNFELEATWDANGNPTHA